ncbi:nuclear transport factor 2 family protein [soil metagenome]
MDGNSETGLQAHALGLIEKCSDAWNSHDLETAFSLMTEDCLFDNTSPAPDGETFSGKPAIRACWEPIFRTPGMLFETEELVVCDDRVTARWRCSWSNADGTERHVRGIDLFKIRNGLIAEKLSYVKG